MAPFRYLLRFPWALGNFRRMGPSTLTLPLPPTQFCAAHWFFRYIERGSKGRDLSSRDSEKMSVGICAHLKRCLLIPQSVGTTISSRGMETGLCAHLKNGPCPSRAGPFSTSWSRRWVQRLWGKSSYGKGPRHNPVLNRQVALNMIIRPQ